MNSLTYWWKIVNDLRVEIKTLESENKPIDIERIKVILKVK